MGGSCSGAATRGRRAATHTLVVVVLALLALAVSAGAALAQPAPTVVITSAPGLVTQDPSPRFAFEARAGSDATRFECRLDDAVVDCAANGTAGTYDASDLAEGSHTFSVRATNDAGATDDDWGPPASYGFRVALAAPAPAVGPPLSQTGPAVLPVPAVATTAATAATAAPQTRVPRLEIGTACMEVSAVRAKARLRLEGRTAIVRFRAPAAARYASVTLRRASGRRRGALVGALASAPIARAAATRTARIVLTRDQLRLVRSGAARLAIAYGTCRSQTGEWQWVANAAS
jgi:hypothetical protein